MYFRQSLLELLRHQRHYFTRSPSLAALSISDVNFFRRVLGPERILTPPADLAKYNTDWLKQYKGKSELILFPKSTEEVSSILEYCNNRRLGVVPQGGNTGLVGGSVPVFDEIIISTNHFNKILNFDKISGVLTCEAGCILETLEDTVSKNGHTIPLDLGAKGSCHIGGNVATNAGGNRLIRFGSLHGSVLGLEAVLASGEVLDLDSRLRKDNTGYDLKHLFIGSEGTLGFITKVSILCPIRCPAQNTCFILVKDFSNALEVLKKAQEQLGEILSAVEFIDSQSYNLVFETFPDFKNPFPAKPQMMYLLIETLGSNDHHDKEKMSVFLEDILHQKLVEDGVLAQDSSQVKSMWKIRESITEALSHRGFVYKYDFSLPHRLMYELVEKTRDRLSGLNCTVVGFGHLGDGNVHLNIASKENQKKILDALEPFVFDWTNERAGSISAEHGLGVMKANKLTQVKAPNYVQWMHQFKKLMDPNGILNPYKVLTHL